MERRPPLCSDVAHVHHGLGVVGIDMEDGGVNHPGHVSGIWRRASHTWVSGEANLITQHKMVEGWNYSFIRDVVSYIKKKKLKKSLFPVDHFVYLDCILRNFKAHAFARTDWYPRGCQVSKVTSSFSQAIEETKADAVIVFIHTTASLVKQQTRNHTGLSS